MNKNFLAFDFGASSGRAILGRLNDGVLTMEEIHRFSNDPVELCGHYYWDTFRLFFEIKQGLIKYANGNYGKLDGIGIDTWGVDFGLLGKNGELLKRIGTSARKDMEEFFGTQVFLDLWVRVKENWRENELDLRSLGFKREGDE